MRWVTVVPSLLSLALLSSCTRQLAYPPEKVLPNESRIEIVERWPAAAGETPVVTGTIRESTGAPMDSSCAIEVLCPEDLGRPLRPRDFTRSIDLSYLGKARDRIFFPGLWDDFSIPASAFRGACALRVVCSDHYPAILEIPAISHQESLRLKVTLSPGGHTEFSIFAQDNDMDYRSTTSGAVISNWNTETGEPSVHPH